MVVQQYVEDFDDIHYGHKEYYSKTHVVIACFLLKARFFGVLGNPWESWWNSPWRRGGELVKTPPYPKEWTDITCAEEDTNLPLHQSLEHIGRKRSDMTNWLLLFDFWLDIPLFWLKYAELTEPRQLNEHLQGIYLCLYYIFSLWTFFRHFMVFTDNCCWHNVRV